MMSDSTQNKPVKERLTFNWPTKSPSKISLSNPKVDMALPEVKLPVKQRVVFPSDRFNGNTNNKTGNNSQRFQRDDTWDSMGDMFSDPPSPPNPWAVGSESNSNFNYNNNKRDDGFNNNKNKNKRRRYEQKDKRNNNHENFNDGGWLDGESNGYGNNLNRGFNNNSNLNSNGTKCQPVKQLNDGWEFDTDFNRKRKDSDEDGNLVIDWSTSVPSNENDNSNCPAFSIKSTATQTDLITTQSIGVQTDFKFDSGYYSHIGGQQQQQLGYYTDSIISSTTSSISNTDHKESGSLIVNKLDSNERNNQSNGPMMMIPENSFNPLHRDPRVARRAKSFQSIISN